MASYWSTPCFKGRTFKLCVLTRWDFNFCVRGSPLRGWLELSVPLYHQFIKLHVSPGERRLRPLTLGPTKVWNDLNWRSKEWCVSSAHADWLISVCGSNLCDALIKLSVHHQNTPQSLRKWTRCSSQTTENVKNLYFLASCSHSGSFFFFFFLSWCGVWRWKRLVKRTEDDAICQMFHWFPHVVFSFWSYSTVDRKVKSYS